MIKGQSSDLTTEVDGAGGRKGEMIDLFKGNRISTTVHTLVPSSDPTAQTPDAS